MPGRFVYARGVTSLPNPRFRAGAAGLMIAFVLSGYAALTYEMSWVRQLVSLFGVTYFAITTILTVFMGGLALGAMVAGRLVDRWRIAPLLAFAALEVFLGIYAQVFPHLREGVEALYVQLSAGRDLSFMGHSLLRFAFAAMILLPPTLASGATLPTACKGFITRDGAIGAGVAWLYGANVAGAAAGCLATTFFTIGQIGFPGTAWLGTAASLGAAVVAVLCHLARRRGAEIAMSSEAVGPGPWMPRAAVVGTAYFAVGFCALASELLWTRVFAQFGANPATYVFGAVLTTYLLGHGLGAGVLFHILVRVASARLLVALLPVGIGALTVGSVIWLNTMPGEGIASTLFMDVGMTLPRHRVWLLIPAVFVPAMLTGAMFPLASRLAIRGVSGVGRGTGSLAALSTSGGILGSFLTGFWLMPALGAVHTLLAIAAVATLAGIWSGWALAGGRRGSALLAAVAASGVACMAVGVLTSVIPRHAHVPLFDGWQVLAYAEGRNASTAALDTGRGDGRKVLFIHGEQAAVGGSDISVAVGLRPEPRRILSIGVGSGTVAHESLMYTDAEEVWAVDVDGELMDLVPYTHPERVASFQSDRFHFVENDGRHFLKLNAEPFDIIVNDAASYAWYLELSTVEFTRLARSQLTDEGLLLARLHFHLVYPDVQCREIATFLDVFPNAVMWSIYDGAYGMLIGRKGDLPLTTDVQTRPREGQRLTPHLLYDTEALRKMATGCEPITDDHPLHGPDIWLPDWYGMVLQAPQEVPGYEGATLE